MLFGGPIEVQSVMDTPPPFLSLLGIFFPKESSLLHIGTTASPLLLPQTSNALERDN